MSPGLSNHGAPTQELQRNGLVQVPTFTRSRRTHPPKPPPEPAEPRRSKTAEHCRVAYKTVNTSLKMTEASLAPNSEPEALIAGPQGTRPPPMLSSLPTQAPSWQGGTLALGLAGHGPRSVVQGIPEMKQQLRGPRVPALSAPGPGGSPPRPHPMQTTRLPLRGSAPPGWPQEPRGPCHVSRASRVGDGP